jgi:thiosulfate reductase / polysulfide reductase chain A
MGIHEKLRTSRRGFLRLGAAASAMGTALASRRLMAMEQDLGGADYSAETGEKRKSVPYTCLACNIEDGGVAMIENGRIVKLEGNMEHPNTRGKLCAKGNSGFLHVYDPDRIMTPLVRTGARGEGKWKRISYDEATSILADKLRDVVDRAREEGEPDILNEMVVKWGRDRTGGGVKRFMHALGSNAMVNHTNVCESSKKVGLEPSWGPDIESPDYANTKYILNFGANILEAAYFMNPNAQRMVDGVVGNRARIVTFDPRLSNTAGYSHEWHAPFPGTDSAIALAMANVIMNEGLYDADFVRDWTNVTVEQLIAHLEPYSPEFAAKESGIAATDIRRIAREFATTKPATTFSYRGPCKHMWGAYQEAAIHMLNVITGNIEKKGGYCLPRGMGWPQPDPVPPAGPVPSAIAKPPLYPLASHAVSTNAPYMVMRGEAKVSVWMTYYDNPVYTYPSSHVWEKFLSDESLVPFFASFSCYMSETTELADLIIPDVTYLERHDPESMPSGLYPCLSIRQPVIEPLGGTQELRQTLIEVIQKVDLDGSRGIRKYFEFDSPEDWMKQHFDNIPGLKEDGGWDYLKEHGVWPIYGKVDKNDGKLVDDNGQEIEAEYGLHTSEIPAEAMLGSEIGADGTIRKDGAAIGVRINERNHVGFGTPSRRIELYKEEWRQYGFNPLPVYKRLPSRDKKSNEMVMSTYKVNVHTQGRTASLKYLAEMYHKNPAWINTKRATDLGIGDGDLIRITSPLGYMVTRAHLTEGLHPEVITISTACGHAAYGRLATLTQRDPDPEWALGGDVDITNNVWWDDRGVHPNPIIQLSIDPIGGSQGWYDTVVTVSPAESGDKYGDTNVSFEQSIKDYEETLRYTYVGDLHRANHQEVDVDWENLPEPKLGSE